MKGRQRFSKKDQRQHRAEKKAARAMAKNQALLEIVQNEATTKPRPNEVKALEARTEAQGHYIIAIKSAQLTFGIGPAGTGKTYIAAAMAAEALASKRIERIILTRPAVEAGEHLGFLPGELAEKIDPYMAPFMDVFHERLGRGFTEYLVRHGTIECAPLAFMRGRTFRNAFVILDEAQNTTPTQMKLFLTRAGEGAKLIVNGDPRQKDIPGPSGLTDAVDRLQGLSGVRTVTFEAGDIVRSGLVQRVIERYELPAAA
ncbi:PhoH family protein [Ectothiorhodospira shaposhnikovii]|uniref:PhoH family protein n=1 Tax=Ectothiorhodospira shaposhnikovii TaxID=1054 RepID=UPI001EE89FA4|nr:PhoH family protein [Ectothiorhodospira shaposhnikovii]MCG5512874.1 PhoH family protein [Ectothiorhodospira shaposhnikovii]